MTNISGRDPLKWTTTNCPTCGTAFEYRFSWPRKYCSNSCKGKGIVSNIKLFAPSAYEVQCEQCGVAFETTPKRTRGRFCSRTCHGAWLSVNQRGDAHPKHGKKVGRHSYLPPPTKKNCEACGKEFITKPSHANRRRGCSRKCGAAIYAAEHSGKANGNWKGGYEPYYGPTWCPAQRAARERDGHCQNCGVTAEQVGRNLDVHHIVPFREFGLDRHVDANNLSNLVALCNACHKKLEGVLT